MDKERRLYNKFVDKLNELLDSPEVSDKELRIILNFLEANNIGANPETNEGLKELAAKLEDELPFIHEEYEVERPR